MPARPADLRLVAARRLVTSPVDARLPAGAGDRPLVAAGDRSLSARRSPSGSATLGLEEHAVPAERRRRPGERWTGPVRRGGDRRPRSGEYVFHWRGAGGSRRASSATSRDAVRRDRPRCPARDRRSPIRAAGRGIRGIVALGGPTRGRLQAGTGRRAPGRRARRRLGRRDPGRRIARRRRDADPCPGHGRPGDRRRRLSSKDRRDFLASEARQRAALHGCRRSRSSSSTVPSAARSPVPSRAARGADRPEVAIVVDPPTLVFDRPDLVVPTPPRISCASGQGRSPGARAARARRSGRAGSRAGSHLEAGAGPPPGRDARPRSRSVISNASY